MRSLMGRLFMEKKCSECGGSIPTERLEMLPQTTVCVRCSTEERAVGFQIYSHKCDSEVFILRGDDKRGIETARAVYNRSR